MNWRYFVKGGAFSLFLLFLSLTVASLAYQTSKLLYPNTTVAQEPILEAAVTGNFPQVLAAKTTDLKPVNVLLLGLDSRKGDKSARCDAIHMFSFRPDEGKIIITSVPRGSMSKDNNIIANVCSLYGFKTAQEEIEKITGVKADHVVKVGFSQVQGILRLAGLPPSPTLQLLRVREKYAIGDNQRSYNQGMFLRDGILKYTDWASKLPWPVQQVGFNMVDTDMTFDQAKDILNQVIQSEIYKDSEKVVVQVRPVDNWVRQEIHVTDLAPTNKEWQKDPEFKDYQNDISGYIKLVVARTNALSEKTNYTAANSYISTPLSQKLWLQIEDEKERNQLHWTLVEAFVYSSTDYDKSKSLLDDFILEMDQTGEIELKSKAEELMKLVNI